MLLFDQCHVIECQDLLFLPGCYSVKKTITTTNKTQFPADTQEKWNSHRISCLLGHSDTPQGTY